MVLGKRTQTARDSKAGPSMATGADAPIGVHRDGYTQYQSGKPTSLGVRRVVLLMLLSGLAPKTVFDTLPAVSVPTPSCRLSV